MSMYTVKNEDDKLFVVRSNDNAYLYQDQNGNLGRTLYRYYSRKDAQHAIERAGHVNQCHIVPLVEKPQPVEVSAKEAEMLERLKSREEYPAELIHRYVDGSHNFSEWDYDREIRLMRAYVNGWTVEKPKRWNVKVPHVDAQEGLWFFVNSDGKVDATYDQDLAAQFTAAEIDQYGLQDCEKVEVRDED